MRRGASVILAWLLVGGSAQADDHREGEYGGVRPGVAATPAPPGKRVHHPPRKDELTWLGFEAKEGAGELFFQAPAGFNVVQWVDKGQLVVVLEGLHRQVKNTRRPLDTRYFDAPVARVTARPVGAHGGARAHKAGIEVRVAFKNPKDAREGALRTATEPDGMFYAYLDLTGGTTAAPREKGKDASDATVQVKESEPAPSSGDGSDGDQ